MHDVARNDVLVRSDVRILTLNTNFGALVHREGCVCGGPKSKSDGLTRKFY